MTEPRFLDACAARPVDRPPVWLMRQAGRYMPEYRAIRARHGFLDMVRQPELAAEITLQPIRAFGMDAAIVFADILPLLQGMGFDLEFQPGRGPVIHNPLREPERVATLPSRPAAETLGFTLEAIRLVRRELGGDPPLIGFSGAPFTLACYAIDGGGSKEFGLTRAFMLREPAAWGRLLGMLARQVADYLIAQAEAGAQALQLFDSWAGVLAPDVYRDRVLPHTREVARAVRARTDVPLIHFGTGTGPFLPDLRAAGFDVIGLDWRTSIPEARRILGPDLAVQGNLDPAVLLTDPDTVREATLRMLQSAGDAPGYIANLGHGVFKETSPEHVRTMVETIRGR